MTQKVVDWGTSDADGHAFNYDFMHFVMHSSSGSMFDRYYQMFVGTDYYWNHYGDYRNPTLVDLIGQLDVTAGAAQQAVADQILTIIGTDMPIIPFGGHPNWYQFNIMYWLGFSNKAAFQVTMQNVTVNAQPTRFSQQARSVVPQQAHFCRRLS